MNLIRNISSTLKTWVFKKKLLKFSGRFRRDPEACFYCPEMCRFSCSTAETLRTDAVTPRGKMSLLHLAERGFSAEKVAGSAENRLQFLEQCTGCGRCTEYCVYEVDVASNLRAERALQLAPRAKVSVEKIVAALSKLQGKVLLAEPGRAGFWKSHPELVQELGVSEVCDLELPHREWGWGKLSDEQVTAIGKALSKCRELWVESPDAAWFLAKGVKEERNALKIEVRTVWQKFFTRVLEQELAADTVFHESYNLGRLLPRLGVSVPMYERGFMPFHSGWNVLDCGGEGFYRQAHPEHAHEMGLRFLHDLAKDGRKMSRIICQSVACLDHLRGLTSVPVVYWLDEVINASKS